MLALTTADWLFVGISPALLLVYLLVSAAFMCLDIFGPPKFSGLGKVQPKAAPSLEDYATLLPVVGRNAAIAVVGFPMLTLPVYRLLGVECTVPSLPQLVLDMVMMAGLFDLWFWAFHRLLHVPRFYHLHKLHHQWKAPCALEGAYFGVVDFCVGNYGPMLLVPPLVSRSFYSALVFGCFGVASVAATHSGYNLESTMWFLGPFAPSTRHDAHHEFFNVNFSTFGVLDWLTGTLLSTKKAAERRQRKSSAHGPSKQQ